MTNAIFPTIILLFIFSYFNNFILLKAIIFIKLFTTINISEVNILNLINYKKIMVILNGINYNNYQ